MSKAGYSQFRSLRIQATHSMAFSHLKQLLCSSQLFPAISRFFKRRNLTPQRFYLIFYILNIINPRYLFKSYIRESSFKLPSHSLFIFELRLYSAHSTIPRSSINNLKSGFFNSCPSISYCFLSIPNNLFSSSLLYLATLNTFLNKCRNSVSIYVIIQ